MNVRDFWDAISVDLREYWKDITYEVDRDPSRAMAYLEKLGLTERPSLVVDCGCGPCIFEPHWTKVAEVIVATDISSSQIKLAKERIGSLSNRIHLIVCDIAHLPLRQCVSDLTVSLGVLRHLPERLGLNVIVEMQRVTKLGGRLYVNDIPNSFHLEAIFYEVGKFVYTMVLKKKVMGIFYYNPIKLAALAARIGLGKISFQGFNWRILPVLFFPLAARSLKKWMYVPLFSHASENTKSPNINLKLAQLSTLEFVATKTGLVESNYREQLPHKLNW